MDRFILISSCFLLMVGCQTAPKERGPDLMIHEDKSPTFWYQVFQREDGTRYIKECYSGKITQWD